MTLAFPKESCFGKGKINKELNGKCSDTLHALDYIKISGSVRNGNNDIIHDFNGTVTVTVFDKSFNL